MPYTIHINVFTNDATFSKQRASTGLLLFSFTQTIDVKPVTCPLIQQSHPLMLLLCFAQDDEYCMCMDLLTFLRCKTIKLTLELTWTFDNTQHQALLDQIKSLTLEIVGKNMKANPASRHLYETQYKNNSKLAIRVQSLGNLMLGLEDKSLVKCNGFYVVHDDMAT